MISLIVKKSQTAKKKLNPVHTLNFSVRYDCITIPLLGSRKPIITEVC